MWKCVVPPRGKLFFLLCVLLIFARLGAQPILHWQQPRIIYFQSASGQASGLKSLQFSVQDPIASLVIQAPDFFRLSSDGQTFSRFVVFPVEDLRKGKQTLFVQFMPDYKMLSVLDTLTLTGMHQVGNQPFFLQGDVISRMQTMDIINWNIEWFGSKTTGFGPADDDLAQRNIRRIMDSLDADVYAFSEVVDTLRFCKLVESIPGYGYALSTYCSGAAANNTAAYAAGQKLAFVFRKSMIRNVKSRGLLVQSEAARVNWANGRFPLLIEAETIGNTGSSGINFVLLHGKSGNTGADHQKRVAAANELKDSLDLYFSNKPLVMLGDFNDDLDTAITTGVSALPSAYHQFVDDTTGKSHYKAVSLLLSKTGSRTISAYPDPVDHVVFSAELGKHYLTGSVRVVHEVSQWIKNYTTTTSDHYPVLSRLLLADNAVTSLVNPDQSGVVYSIFQHGKKLEIVGSHVHADLKINLYALNGELLFHSGIMNGINGRFRKEIDISKLSPGVYVVHVNSNAKTKAIRIFIHP